MMYDEDDVAFTQTMADNERELEQRNRRVKNYSTVEVVAIPPDFDIEQYLSMRESAGIFDKSGIDLKTLKIIAEGVKYTPVFCLQNNIRINPITCMFFIKVVNELGLILRSVHNPLREGLERYMQSLDEGSSDLYISGQVVERVNFTIINIFPLMNDEIINEVMTIAHRLQEEQEKFNEKMKTVKL